MNLQSCPTGGNGAFVQSDRPAPEAQCGVTLKIGDRSVGIEKSVRHDGERFFHTRQEHVQVIFELLGFLEKPRTSQNSTEMSRP